MLVSNIGAELGIELLGITPEFIKYIGHILI